ncbi:37S ribosomal protein RSM18 mitochondrial [Spathaspora sp. JA1]|nr:37S ribosomal protein RSM18 mitochondrial [Spathaspora sp. JA1]
MLSSIVRTSGRIIVRPLSTSTIKFQKPVEPAAVPETPNAAPEESINVQAQSWNDVYAEVFLGTKSHEDEVVYKPSSIKEEEPPAEINPSLGRRFQHGQTYNPFHFSMDRLHMERSQRRIAEIEDPFERCGMNPRNLYMMPEVLSKFISETGQILPRSKTGCSAKNQKLLSNAIKTARAIGVLSSVHRHHRFMPQRNF